MLEGWTEREKQLLALIFEFEGSIVLFQDKRYPNTFRLDLRVYNTKKILLEVLQKMLNCGKIYKHNKYGKFSEWVLVFCGNPKSSNKKYPNIGFRLYKELEPYLITKRKQLP
jgi:hypothetical protein